MLKQSITKIFKICAVVILAISQPAFAQISEFKITATDGATNDQFGYSVSISGDYAVVGADGDDDNGSNSGSAYVFKRTGTSWVQETKLLASDGAANDRFGNCVSIFGDYVVVGAELEDENGYNSGSAYVFKHSGTSWVQEAKLLASDGAAYERFGVSVSISGDYAVVGANVVNSTETGSAYVFKRSGTSWAQEAKLLASDGAAVDEFGVSVSISGDYAIVGARNHDDNGDNSGSAYVFKRSGTSWAQEAKLLAADGAGDDRFGVSVSIFEDYAVVGAYGDDDNGWDSGSAYVFKRTGTSWVQEAKLLASDGAAYDWFGLSVSISGDYAVVGARNHDDNGDNSGSAYVFKRSGTSWVQEAKLLASDGVASDWFGHSVSNSGDYAVMGAVLDDDNGESSGSVYVYSGFSPSILINVPADQPTIQAAIDVATDGDTVLVQPGTYTENINFNGKSILVISSDGADVTIIDGNQSGSVVTFTSGEGENSRLEGFTLTNGSGTTVDANTYGGGIYCIEASPSILECRIISNSVLNAGGGFYLSSSSPKIDHCIFSGNTSGQSSGGLYLVNSSSPEITYCLITGNSAQHGGGMSIYSGSSPWLINCTFSGNYAAIQGGGLYVHGTGTTPIMVNSFLWDDAAGTSGQEIYICCGPSMTINYSDINPSDITGSVSNLSDNINADPLFVSPLAAGEAPTTGGDYHLSVNSPAIDAATAFFELNGDTLVDLLASEYQGAAPDLGAFEFNLLAPILSVSPLSLDFGDILFGETAIEQVTVKNTGTADLNVTTIAITGVDSLNFSVNTSSFTLAPGDSQIVHINFIPDSTGMFSAMLDIESDGGNASITLQGLGIYPAPSIIAITDVPDDQGGWVYLSWTSSLYDALGEITQYGVWELSPEDEWVSLGNVPSIQEDEYIYLAHTFGDSTDEGIFWSTFMVTAHTADPEMFYTSAVDSGYSVDNLAPAVPTGLLASVIGENTVELSWDSPVDEDFNYFKIYRSLTPDFDPTGMEPFAEAIDITFIDREVEIGVTYYYILSAVDFNGNESEYSEAVDAPVLSTADELGIPTEFALQQNYPNPFNPVTTVRYDLPEQTMVRLTIFDILGRDIKILVNQEQEPGFNSILWNARDDFGKPVGAGVYIYRIEAGDFIQSKKMILLK